MPQDKSRKSPDKPKPEEAGRRGGHPTPQGFKAAGPGNLHGIPPDDSPGDAALPDRPFSAEGGRPAADPERKAQQLLDQVRQGPRADGDAGPLGVEEQARNRSGKG